MMWVYWVTLYAATITVSSPEDEPTPFPISIWGPADIIKLVELDGLEPTTSSARGKRSSS